MWINCICLVLQIHLQIAESYQVSEPFHFLLFSYFRYVYKIYKHIHYNTQCISLDSIYGK